MKTEQIALVQQSFNKVVPIAEIAAALFYGKLFELDPSLRPMFKGDIEEQGKKLMRTLALVVRGLDRPERILPAVESLGVQHNHYGVKPEHYDTVGQALLWTLEWGLWPEFKGELREAWIAAYELLAFVMRKAASEAAAA